MGEWRVQRTNHAAGRFEWLRSRPDFYPAGSTLPDGSTAAEDTVVARWTWQDPGDPSDWRNGNVPRDFGRRAAEKWAALVDGDDVLAVRSGEPDAAADPVAEARERLREARRAYREAVAAGQDDGQ